VEEALAPRRHLLFAARALAAGGVLAEVRIAEISAGRSSLDLATDLQSLRETFLDARDAIDGKTLVTDDDLHRAASSAPSSETRWRFETSPTTMGPTPSRSGWGSSSCCDRATSTPAHGALHPLGRRRRRRAGAQAVQPTPSTTGSVPR